MKDNIKQVVKDVKYLIATDCNDETIQARIENFIKEDKETPNKLASRLGFPPVGHI